MAEYRFPLPTDTAAVRIESRQYKLLKMDLGEGVPRRKLGVGALIVLPYWAALAAVFHLSPLAGGGKGGAVFIAPAALLVFLALRPDAGGRARYVMWLDRFRFLVRRYSPMIASPIANTQPGRPFIVSARWTVVDVAASRRLRKTLREIDAQSSESQQRADDPFSAEEAAA